MFVLTADADGVPAKQQGVCRGEEASSGLLGKNGRALGTDLENHRAQVRYVLFGGGASLGSGGWVGRRVADARSYACGVGEGLGVGASHVHHQVNGL